MARFSCLLVLALAACTHAPQQWYGPPGATKESFDRQLSQCNAMADIQNAQDPLSRLHTIFDCMNGAGYELRDVQPDAPETGVQPARQ